jgi:hypothetical protein
MNAAAAAGLTPGEIASFLATISHLIANLEAR